MDINTFKGCPDKCPEIQWKKSHHRLGLLVFLAQNYAEGEKVTAADLQRQMSTLGVKSSGFYNNFEQLVNAQFLLTVPGDKRSNPVTITKCAKECGMCILNVFSNNSEYACGLPLEMA